VAFIMPSPTLIPMEARVSFSNVMLPDIGVPEVYPNLTKKPVV
jgi:hypothetical protein